MDAVQQLAQPCEAVLERFHVDTRYIAAKAPDSFPGQIERNRRGGRMWSDLRDEFGVVWSMPEDRPYYMDISHHPLAGATVADVARYPFPKGDDPAASPACAKGPFGCGRRRLTPWCRESAAWCMKSAGTCAACSSGSSISRPIRSSAGPCWTRRSASGSIGSACFSTRWATWSM